MFERHKKVKITLRLEKGNPYWMVAVMYAKSFLCEMTIYPDFHKNQYSGYLKEQFNKWIIDCFRAYTASFKLEVIQHGAKCYVYDSETDTKDINLKKLWQNQFGSYIVKISGEGIIMNGAKAIVPPINIAEEFMDKMTLKYMETSDIGYPVMIAFGKGIGLPLKYSMENTDGEEWRYGFCGSDIYCPNFEIDIACSNTNFDNTLSVIKKISTLNSGENANIEADPYGFNIRITAAYHLFNKHKVDFLKTINELCNLAIQDDCIVIEEFNLNFSSNSNFALESYVFNEKDGRIDVKNITFIY